MGATLNEQTQYFDDAGDPLVDGKVYIGDQNSDPVTFPKAIFSDRELTIALANPQALDSAGRTANKIWTDGNYSIRVDDVLDNQVYQQLDNGTAQDGTILSLTGITGADTITATGETTILSYVDKKIYFFYPVLDNTDAVTLNIDAVGAKDVVKKYGQPLDAGDFQAGEAVIVSFNAANDNLDWLNQSGSTAAGIVDAESIGIVPNNTDTDVQTANTTAINTALDVEGNNIIFGGGVFSFNGTWSMEKSVMVCGSGSGATVWNFTNIAVDAIENHGDDGSDKRKQSIICKVSMTMTGTQNAGLAAVLSRAPLFMHDVEIGVKGSSSKFSLGVHLDGVTTFESAAENKFQNVNITTCSSHGVHIEGNVVGAFPRRGSWIACRTELNGGDGMLINGALSTPQGINIKDMIFSTNDGIGLNMDRHTEFHTTGLDAFSNDAGGSNTDISVAATLAVTTGRIEIAGLSDDAATNLDVTLANLTNTPIWYGNVDFGTAVVTGFEGVALTKNTTQALGSEVETLLTFQVKEYDTDGFVDLGVSDTNIVIPSGKGYTHAIVSAQVGRESGTGQCITRVKLNGVDTALTPALQTESVLTEDNNMCSGAIPISDGDIFTLTGNLGSASNITALTSFSLRII